MTATAARHHDQPLAEFHELGADPKRARAALAAERCALAELLSDGAELGSGEFHVVASFQPLAAAYNFDACGSAYRSGVGS